MAPRSKRLLRGVLAASAIGLPLGASIALADAIDPSAPKTVIVGSPRGFAPSERLDEQRTGRSKSRLPFPPVEIWRRHISGGIEVAPLVDAGGNILIPLTVPEVMKLGPDGKEIWRARLGTAAALTPPVLTSDGTLTLVTSAGQAWGIAPSGAARYNVQLGIRGRDADTTALALDDGGVVIAAGRALLEIGADGAVRARTQLEERATGALVAGPEGTLITADTGTVYTWRPPGAPRRVGSFGGAPRRGAALSDARTLVAVVDGRKLVALDLPTGTAHVLGSSGGFLAALDAPVTIGPSKLAVVTTQSGIVVGVDASGNEKFVFSLDRSSSAGADAGAATSFFGSSSSSPSPPLIIDPEGRIGFARTGGRVGVVSPEGVVAVASERVCSVPVAVAPAGERRMVVACRDGAVWMLGE